MDLLGLLRLGVDEHLDLVELMDAQDAAGVLAVGTGLSAEAGRPAGVAHRTVRQVDDLILVVAGQGDLGGADQVHVIGLEAVDLVGVGAEEAGTGHDLRTHQHRRDHQLETVVASLLCGELQQAELQQGAVAGEEVEAGTGDLRPALHVDQPQGLAELQVVLRLEVELCGLTDVLQDDVVVLATGGRAGDHVGQLHLQVVDGSLGGVLLGLELLDLRRAGLPFGTQCGAFLVGGVLHLRAHRLGVRLGVGSCHVSGGNRLTATLIGLQKLVHQAGVLTAGTLGITDDVGVLPEELEINHVVQLSYSGALRGPMAWRKPASPVKECPLCRPSTRIPTETPSPATPVTPAPPVTPVPLRSTLLPGSVPVHVAGRSPWR